MTPESGKLWMMLQDLADEAHANGNSSEWVAERETELQQALRRLEGAEAEVERLKRIIAGMS